MPDHVPDHSFDLVRSAGDAVADPTPEQARRARQALRAHIESGSSATAHRAGRGRRILLAAAAAAAIIVGGYAATRPETALVQTAEPQPPAVSASVVDRPFDLTTALSLLASQPAPTGDVTIVERVHSGGGLRRRGVDVFADDGRYAYVADGRSLPSAGALGNRPWPVDANVVALLARVGEGRLVATEPGDAVQQFVSLYDESSTHSSQALAEADVWDLIVSVGPASGGSVSARLGILAVLADLAYVDIYVQAEGNEAVAIVAERNGPVPERLVLDSRTGLPVRWERQSDGSTTAMIEYTVERRTLAG